MSNPKQQKALELTQNIYDKIDESCLSVDANKWNVDTYSEAKDVAKQCALVLADEIIKEMYHVTNKGLKEYWKEVKEEINKL